MPNRYLLPCAAIAMLLAGPVLAGEPPVTEAERIGFDELSSGQNLAAIREIRANDGLAKDDPARNINLGIAFAREGLLEEARTYFEAALVSRERADLQTAGGEWVDSRELARQGLRKLARGEFQRGAMASLR